MTDEPMISMGELETVPQNLFGISPIVREKRPYISSPKTQKEYLKFLGYERGVLTSRIAELNSRADQILYIYLCRKSKAYLAVADRTANTSRQDDSYFYDWLDELAAQGVAYASKRLAQATGKSMYRWNEIQRVIDLCLSKGIDEETAAKVAAVGVKAVDTYLRYGIVSLDDTQEARFIGKDTPIPGETASGGLLSSENDRGETQADILTELAQATSSRGASMLARDRVGTDYARVSSISEEKESDVPGYKKYSAEVQIVQRSTGEYTPYEIRVYFEEATPMLAIKFMLSKWSQALSRII